MPSVLLIDGNTIGSELDLHELVETQLRPSYYGRNLDALDEILALELTPPVSVLWINADNSRQVLGPRFDRFVSVFRDASEKYAPGEYVFELKM